MNPRQFYPRYEEWKFITETIGRELARVMLTCGLDTAMEAMRLSREYGLALADLGLEEEE